MRILIIEDDRTLNKTISYQLQREGYQVDSCYDGKEALQALKQKAADLILLDRMLPYLSGTDLLQYLREMGDTTPVILLTALGTLQDRVEGLDLGADDYLVKPFAMEELLARIRSLSRRVDSSSPASGLCFHDISYQSMSNELTGPGGTCTLSLKEGSLLEAFLRSGGQTLTRGQLLNKVWGLSSDVEDGNLDNYIFFLRRRLQSVCSQTVIQTIRGVGYRLNSK